jgi:hypothetical protein
MSDGIWAKVHQDLFEHEKFDGLDNDAVVMWLSAVLYCKRRKVDGIVAIDKIRTLPNVKRWRKCYEILVKKRIFDELSDGKNIQIHGWLEWQTPRSVMDQAAADKQKDNERKAKWLADKKAKDQEKANEEGKDDASRDASQEPYREQSKSKSSEQQLTTLATDSVDCGRESFVEAIMTVCKLAQTDLTASARGAVNSAVKQLRDAGASPGEIEARAEIYRRLYPDAVLTPSALVKHWPALTQQSIPLTSWERALAELEAEQA